MQTLRRITGRYSLIILLALVLTLLCLPATSTAQTPTVTPPAPAEETPSSGSVESTMSGAAESVAARTPIPPPTPSLVQREVADLTETLGLDDVTFLRLSAADWINLGISVILFLLGYWAAAWFVGHFLRRLARRTQTHFDDRFLANIEQELKWLLGILLLQFSVMRLAFIPGGLRTLLDDIFFILALIVVVRIAVKFIDFGLDWYETYLGSQKRSAIDPAIVMLKNAGKLLVYVTGVSIVLSHYGLINNALLIVLFAIGVVVALSIKDIMTDIIYGFIILVGQPFRVGDAIHVESMHEDDWGWVAEIGSRETHIRTRDNRMLVIPNGSLGTDQIINYMSPDPAYRVQTDLYLAYGSDFDQIQQMFEQTTRGVDGVLPDKPVEVLHWRFGAFYRIVRVRWWIASCEEDHQMTTRVNAALEAALDAAGVQIGDTKVDLQVDNR